MRPKPVRSALCTVGKNSDLGPCRVVRGWRVPDLHIVGRHAIEHEDDIDVRIIFQAVETLGRHCRTQFNLGLQSPQKSSATSVRDERTKAIGRTVNTFSDIQQLEYSLALIE